MSPAVRRRDESLRTDSTVKVFYSRVHQLVPLTLPPGGEGFLTKLAGFPERHFELLMPLFGWCRWGICPVIYAQRKRHRCQQRRFQECRKPLRSENDLVLNTVLVIAGFDKSLCELHGILLGIQ